MNEGTKYKLRYSKEWKKQREEIIEGKVCAWCGSDKALVVHHYNEPKVTGLAKWKSIMRSTEKQKKYADLPYEELKEIVDQKFAKWKEKYLETYMDFSPENVLILCKKCHFALHKGMVLCKVCKKKYHKRRFDMCYTCFHKAEDSKDADT